ncbi:hypothetical protein C0992_000590, partial [Termitomyces sp. T32_za158]
WSGLASGVLQQGYAVGYLFAACINLKLVLETAAQWRSLFWTVAGISLFSAVIRAFLPESEVFLRAKAIEKAKGTSTGKKTRVFIKESGEMLKRHWVLCIRAVLLMTASLYALSEPLSRSGSSQHPSARSPREHSVFSLAFKALGVLYLFNSQRCPRPHFAQHSPESRTKSVIWFRPRRRNFEATGGDNLRTTIIVNGQPTDVLDYATVQGILIGVFAAFVLFITIIGPEKHGAHFEKHRAAFEEGGGRDDALFEDEVQHETRDPRSLDEKVRPSVEKLHGGTPYKDPATNAKDISIYLTTSFAFDSSANGASLFDISNHGPICYASKEYTLVFVRLAYQENVGVSLWEHALGRNPGFHEKPP